MKLLLSILFLTSTVQASDFCTVITSEDHHQFNKTYKIHVLNYSCTDGTQFDFKTEEHSGVETWDDGHNKYFPAFSSKLLKQLADKNFDFKNSSNLFRSTRFFFYKEKKK